MKSTIHLLVCSLSLLDVTNAYAALGGNFDLIYDSADGSLKIDTEGVLFIGYRLSTGNVETFLEDYRHPPDNLLPILYGPRTATPTELSESNPFAPQIGVFNLGTVLPAGLSKDDYFSIPFGDNSQSYYRLGIGIVNQSFELVYVPEPTSLAVLGFAGLFLSRRRR